jgi:predicted transcriptional regulator
MDEKQSLGQLELEVLKAVWNQPGSTVNEITDALLQQKEYARTTILTVVQRLHKKGFLTRNKKQGAFRYYPTESKEEVMGSLTRRFIQSTFEGSASNLIQHLTTTSLSADELAEMRNIIDQAMKNEGEK